MWIVKSCELPMAKVRIDEVSQWEHGRENILCGNDGRPKKWARFFETHEGDEVHPFVFGFFQKGMDPAVITLHPAKGVKMPDHGGGKSGDT